MKGQQAYRVVRFTWIIVLLVAALFPFYWTVNTAFAGGSAYNMPPNLVPTSLSLRGFHSALSRDNFFRWIYNTLIVAAFTVMAGVLIATAAGYNLSRFKSRFNSIVENVILGSRMMPGAVLILPTFMMFRYVRLVNSLTSLVLANILFALPLCVWMLKGFIDAIPPSLEEVAMTDGCTRLGAFYRVILPLCVPGVTAVAIFTTNLVWGEFFFARILVVMDSSKWVFSLGLATFRGQFELDYFGLMAAVFIYLVFPVAMFRFSQRAFVSGMTAGAVKG
ncbi:MAG: carbohydrate ABC transporter permease [Spirochaetaceae bacterium]|nr:MAG: carbohydrate ABC transporter permease [Spirochaetaceae bacterium]